MMMHNITVHVLVKWTLIHYRYMYINCLYNATTYILIVLNVMTLYACMQLH